MHLSRSCATRALSVLILCTSVAGQDYSPKVESAGKAAEQAIAKFKVPADLQVSLFAAEPALANPVAFCIDTRGRVYVAESFRLHKGVTDNRQHRNWIDEELACRTVADRVKMYQRRFAKELDQWTSEHERIRVLEDTDGDGRADRSTVYADGFKDLADGIGAGLLAYEGRIWFTCIPKLWLLEDVDDDGKADTRRVLHDGYGVHTSLLGHDLHGLRIGPDGKLYFSIGDRGFHVVTPQRTLSMPDEGAVFRCNLDGSDLEVVHRGLRNPQELAFDKFGNLFTGDNNSDGGDKARWVYVVEGGNSGWHIGFQSLSDRGPWNRERLWHPHHRGQAAYLVPPITNLINGPSGLTYDPGVGLPARYRDHFFLCEFRGSSSISGVVALRVAPKGAGFELTDTEEFLWRVLPTDVEFGFDGGLYVLDWTEGWNQPLRGRIYKVAAAGAAADAAVRESGRLLREGMAGRPVAELAALLDHADQRVRQEAQFELVRRRQRDTLAAVAQGLERRMARIHAIWGLGQLGQGGTAVGDILLPILRDPDHEIRCQVAKVLGSCRLAAARDPLIEQLRDRSSRARFFAAISLGQLGDGKAVDPLIRMLAEDDGRDPYLRHAGVQGLRGMPDEAALLRHAGHRSVPVRLALVVALRQRESAAVRRFLADADPLVVLEAARAIHDEPIPAALPDLAGMLTTARQGADALLRRVINANFRLGDPDSLDRLVRYAAGGRDPAMRAEALDALRQWRDPSGRDRVVNLWRPVPERDAAQVLPALTPHLDGLLAAEDRVVHGTIQLLRAYRSQVRNARLRALVADTKRGSDLRLTALQTLEESGDGELVAAARAAAGAEAAGLRNRGVKILARRDPASAAPRLLAVVGSKARMTDQQAAVNTLGELPASAAADAVGSLLDRLRRGALAPQLELEVLEAAARYPSGPIARSLADFRRERSERAAGDVVATHLEALEGGDRRRGDDLFWKRDDSTACKKCHSINGRGGNAGPDLGDVGRRLTRKQILTAMLAPSREIAQGFGTFMFTLDDGKVVAGMIHSESADQIVLLDAEGKEIQVARRRIRQRSDAVSSMPPMVGILKPAELRDLVEYLMAQRKKPAARKATAEPTPGTTHGKQAAAAPRGPWRAWLESPGGELPFALEFRAGRDGLAATIGNGAERIEVPVVEFAGDRISLTIDYFDSTIAARLDPTGSRLDGTWTRRRGAGAATRMAFHATAGAQPRFALAAASANPDRLQGRWQVQFEKDPHPAVGEFHATADGRLTGTFLTTLGDYRYLAGAHDGSTLRLSCFDGAHAFLFHARRQPDGSLRGDFWSSTGWHETWTGRRDPAARLPDAWQLTKAVNGPLAGLRFPDLQGRPRSLADPEFAGRARILLVFGSWCPNCKDETRYLADLHRRYRDRGLQVIGLAFEHARDPQQNARLLRTYMRHQGIDFPVLLAGLSDKAKASQALPILDRVRAFPTTLFLDGRDRVRAVHTGFAGPGTGAAHDRLRQRFESLVEELLTPVR